MCVLWMMSWELFKAQAPAYREKFCPGRSKRLAVEAGHFLGWQQFVGDAGEIISIDHFGASAPGAVNGEVRFYSRKYCEQSNQPLQQPPTVNICCS